MKSITISFILLFCTYLFDPGCCIAGDQCGITISDAETDRNGFLVHTVSSPYQQGETKIRVLLPGQIQKKKKYRVLFVLPVEANEENRFGDGLLEIKKAKLHNKYHLICVAPTFSHLPWYANHPTDRTIQQETYFMKVVVPFVDRSYPTTQCSEGRYLLGFSKSGWGAFSLILRHPEIFAKAAAWDAPLMKQKPDQFGMGPVFGSQENFKQYKISSLIQQKASQFQKRNRLILTGYGNFRKHHLQFHQLIKENDIDCIYRDGPKRNHHWNSGWVAEAIELLMLEENDT